MSRKRSVNGGTLTLSPEVAEMIDRALDTGMFGSSRMEFVRHAIAEKLYELCRAGIIFPLRTKEPHDAPTSES